MPHSWCSAEGKARIRSILKECIPQWASGPRPHQVESVARTLDKVNQILIVPTGGGKTAAFYAPLLVLQYLRQNPEANIPPPPSNPVVIVISPLIELANNHVKCPPITPQRLKNSQKDIKQVREMLKLDIRAVAVHKTTLNMMMEAGRDIFSEIQLGQWSVVILTAERLASRPVEQLFRDENFCKNIISLGIDEAHVLIPWSKSFRVAYRQIGLVHRRLPAHIPLIAVTATLGPGKPQEDLQYALGLQNCYCLRLSSERQNIRTVIRPLASALAGRLTFPEIMWALKPGNKTVVYCQSLNLVDRVGDYARSTLPEGPQRLKKVRIWTAMSSPAYNEETLKLFQSSEDTVAIIATVAFGMGMDVRNIRTIINLGHPPTLDDLVQQIGRAGRDLVTPAEGWTLIEPSVLTSLGVEAEERFSEGEDKERKPRGKGKASDVARGKSAKRRGKAKATCAVSVQGCGLGPGNLDVNLTRLLRSHVKGHCLEAELNAVYGNPGEDALLPCNVAKRQLYCSSCDPLFDHALSYLAAPTEPPPNNLPASAPTVGKRKMATVPLPLPLSKETKEHARQKLIEFGDSMWRTKTGARYRFVPSCAYWTHDSLDCILADFHLLRTRDALHTCAHMWEFKHTDTDMLFALVDQLNRRYDKRGVKGKEIRLTKAAATRAKNAAAKAQSQMSADKENVPAADLHLPTGHLAAASPTTIAPASVISPSIFSPPPNTLVAQSLDCQNIGPPTYMSYYYPAPLPPTLAASYPKRPYYRDDSEKMPSNTKRARRA